MSGAERNLALYPWYRFLRNLLFWQATWFLYFQQELSAAEAILLYAVYDVATTALEVPSGYMSDRFGRRLTLLAAAVAGLAGAFLLAFGEGFAAFALAQVCIGAAAAFASGTDTALLYESLAATGRREEMERREVAAWRASFAALALSAVTGGFLGQVDLAAPFVASLGAAFALLLVTVFFTEPERSGAEIAEGGELARLRSLGAAFRNPTLLWLLALAALMYVFSHLPFVFGQPFIFEALRGAGLEAQAPLVSGFVSAAMMAISLFVSLFAAGLRRFAGLPALLLFAFGMQIGLAGALALSDSLFVIALLCLRMAPDALSQPFIVARVQPLLSDGSRATFLSLKSLVARLLFAGSLGLASLFANTEGAMPHSEIGGVLLWFLLPGLLAFAGLAATAARAGVEPGPVAREGVT